MKMATNLLACVCTLLLIAGCSGVDDSGYQPPDLGSGADGLTIEDAPVEPGDSADGDFPEPGSYLGFVFQARESEVYDIQLERTSGTDVPAIALYHYADGVWGAALVWATADAASIGIGGWAVPRTGTYLVLIEVVSGNGQGSFVLSIQCTDGCEDPIVCVDDADCAAGEVCFDGLCFEDEIECRSDSDCPADEICASGFCVDQCRPEAEICDGIDNDCDGLIDEDCPPPCTSDADCSAGYTCIDGLCMEGFPCRTDSDCMEHQVCDLDTGRCVPACRDADNDGFCADEDCDDNDPAIHPGAVDECDGIDNDCDGVDEGCGLPCSSDADCAPGEACFNGLCVVPCRDDSECPAGQACVGGVCQAGCTPQPEVCDGVDNDCDGAIDEDFDLLHDPQNCGGCGMACAPYEMCDYGMCVAPCDADYDGDGYLAADCGGTDCNDYDAWIHPGAEELCNDLDDDCDGMVDEDCTTYCREDADCPAGQVCVDGVCVNG